ncbi:C2 calcium-dependent domain-containing protein 4A [Desmodus rotundus]|uniref:C2 calcium-dependent domain-containing protein 4A n=1 Tax=Desmodus rotundus TaxID=9430 RepID=UPI0023814606|nr:C2 calcium-dependent domain-containing protein 4A [Desmodus rotundus]XP_053785116.1 C2 calcium-dependent domain-containing protein 4A [Desmodus rotundus]
MSCLERHRLGPPRLLRGGNWRLQGRAGGTPALCANVLTPDSIPEFCIPPRLAPCPALTALRNSWVKKAGADDGAGLTDWDPRSQAALSLPHLPRARTAFGFCALLESPHTRRKESLFLGDPGAAGLPPQRAAPPALHPRAHTYRGCGGDAPLQPSGRAPGTTPAAPGCPRPPGNTLALGSRGHRLLHASERLLNRALKTSRSHDPACAGSVSSGDEDENKERDAGSGSPARALSASPPLSPGPRPERLEAEGTVALGRAGSALRLAAEYSPASGRLRLRLLHPEGPAGGAAEPRALGCRVSLVLQPPGKTRQLRSAVMRGSHKAVFDQDFCFDGLSEDELRRLAVRVKAEKNGRGQGELLLGSLLLP